MPICQDSAPEPLAVFRDRYESYERVGCISFPQGDIDEPVFAYDRDHLASPSAMAVSLSLPLVQGNADPQVTSAFFEGLLAEGAPRRLLADSLRLQEDDFTGLLGSLDYESAGDLLFSRDGLPPEKARMRYAPLDTSFFSAFAERPAAVMLRETRRNRVSIAGTMNKVGLYLDERSRRWYLPSGGAPTTHIVKAGEPAYPDQVENEALCLRAARALGLPAAECHVITAGNGSLLAVRRFDRVIPDAPLLVEGLPVPRRLRQEDFCQAIGRPGHMKYEEFSSEFLPDMVDVIYRACTSPLRDLDMLFRYLAFDYLIGNCDNHLKNFALFFPQGAGHAVLAPLYDVLHCPAYEVSLDMGMPLSAKRGVYDLGKAGLEARCKRVNYAPRRALAHFTDLYRALPRALDEAEASLLDEGMPTAKSFKENMRVHAARVAANLGLE